MYTIHCITAPRPRHLDNTLLDSFSFSDRNIRWGWLMQGWESEFWDDTCKWFMAHGWKVMAHASRLVAQSSWLMANKNLALGPTDLGPECPIFLVHEPLATSLWHEPWAWEPWAMASRDRQISIPADVHLGGCFLSPTGGHKNDLVAVFCRRFALGSPRCRPAVPPAWNRNLKSKPEILTHHPNLKSKPNLTPTRK